MSQEQFGRLFHLSKSNVNSYEGGALPKLEKYLEIMDYFKLDPSKFMRLDMSKYSVFRKDDTKPTQESEEERSKQIDSWIDEGVAEHVRYQYLEGLNKEEIRRLYIQQKQVNQDLLRENLELKDKYIRLLESNKESEE